MPSKTLWFNKELLFQIIRSTGWISIVYFIGLTFALPLEIMALHSEGTMNHFANEPVNSLYQFGIVFQISLLIAIPVLLAVFLFRFLQVKQAAEMMHSLPIKRGAIFHHYALTGSIILIMPVILTSLIVTAIYYGLDLSNLFQMKDIYIWTGTTLLLNLLLFTSGIFVAMMTGISVVQGVLTYILLLFPAGIAFLLLTNFNHLLLGFPGDYYLNSNIEKLSPLTFFALLDERTLGLAEVIIYTILTIFLYFSALYFYKKRKIENASEAIAFSKLRSIFKYGVTFCMMLFGGMYFSVTQSKQLGWIIFGYVMGAVIGYYLSEMLLQKTWRVFRKFKGIVVYGVCMTVVMIGLQGLGFYEKKVPEMDKIKNVLLADSPHVYMDEKTFGYVFTPKSLKEQANIQAVRELHEKIIVDFEGEKPDQNQYETAFFLYEMDNGRKVIRQYNIKKAMYKDYYKKIYESEEYKRASYEIFHLNEDEVDYFTIKAGGPLNKYVTFKNPDEIHQIIERFKEDVLAESYEDNIYYQGTGSYIEFFIDRDHTVYLNIPITYNRVEQWLEEKGMLERTKVMPEDIKSVEIVKGKMDPFVDIEQITAEIQNRQDVLKVEDKKQIANLLSSVGSSQDYQYVALIQSENSEFPEIYYMDEKHAPNFVKEHFK